MKKVRLSIVTALFFIGSVSFAQDVEFKASNFKDNKDEFKVAEEHFEKGEEFLELGNEAIYAVLDPGNNFHAALKEFQIAYDFNPKSALLNFYMGNAYLYTNEKYKAKKYLDEAYKLNPEVDDFLDFYRGMAEQLDMNFGEAIKLYKKFENNSKSKQIESLGRMLKQRINECESGQELVAKPRRVWVDNMKTLNSPQDDYSPCITTDGTSIMITSRRPNGHTPDEVGNYDGDIYMSEMKNGKWTAPKNAGEPLSTTDDETASMLSYDGTKLLTFKSEGEDYNIYQSELDGANWTKPEIMHRSVNTIANQTYASLAPNRRRLYIITDKKTGGMSKGTDVYELSLMNNSRTEYGSAVTVGIEVNTKFNEGSVYIHPTGDFMFFCSEGHNSMGGYDIFVSEYKQGQWQEPENLGYPINTPYDDYFFAMTASEKYAYIASNREGGQGGLDIYKVTFWGDPKEQNATTEDYLLASIANPIKEVQIEKEVKVDKKALTVFKGKTIDALTGKAVEAEIDITDNATGKVIETFTTNSATGKFLLSLTAGKNYGIAVKAPGYLFHSENFDVVEPTGFNMVNKVIELKNIKKGSKIALRNIFFDSGKSDLKPESNTELDRLVKLLKDVPSLVIEISGHTDNVGSESMNAKLSQARADAVVSYLIGKGIKKDRLESKGYGSSQPVASNSTAEGRQQNRRTEFEILAN
ncbi:OmpA family protein [Parvicella tangerina]|uniref:Peptidoglycan-associated lipoprotein n=1 Tax=Parvicella tangerina TaxID=2829795 RepID=A0A916NI63_9FLAO|nr:OmpA family protein [Parvicella tangerina]CAG5083284.1 Peptidoglycan-associated lipoprotein [Parvicella tangerina]